MPIQRPTTKTIISTTNWGIPITDEVNRMTPLVNATVRAGANRRGIQSSLPINTFTDLTWSTVIQDTNAYITTSVQFTIPVGLAGLYVCSVAVTTSQANPNAYLSIFLGGERGDFLSTNNGRFTASFGPVPAAEGSACYASIWNGGTVALTPTGSNIYLYRISA